MGESRRTNRTGRGTRRRRTEGSIMAEATAWSAGLRASVVRLGNSGAQLVGRLWDDAQTLARGGSPREVASRLAADALDASAEARRQAEELLRRLGGPSPPPPRPPTRPPRFAGEVHRRDGAGFR